MRRADPSHPCVRGGCTMKRRIAACVVLIGGLTATFVLALSASAFAHEKQTVDERFTSGPTTFDDLADPADVEFPTKVPTGTELAARLDREIPRLNEGIAAARSDARDEASTAKTLGTVGIVVGALGLILAIVAMVGWRRSVRRSSPVAVAPGTEVRARD